MADGIPSGAVEFIEDNLSRFAEALEAHLKLDVVTISGPMLYGIDDLVRDNVESRKVKRDGIAVILETTGGFIEPVRRIVEVLRRHYPSCVEFFIPSNAMSAGTVLAMSGDAIHMDYYSVLGPIDPQVEREGRFVPALGYLVQYRKLLAKANAGRASTAEIALLLNFDQAELFQYDQDRELSIVLLKEWLVKYKFKDWTITEGRKIAVTQKMKEDRAKLIASILNKTDRWHTHGHGITMEVLRRELNLVIDDFGDPAKDPLNELVRSYHRLLVDYLGGIRKTGCIHRAGRMEYL